MSINETPVYNRTHLMVSVFKKIFSPYSPERTLLSQGFLILFLELVLMRFLAGNIWNLGYFPNLVLLAVFIGMGTGFISHRSFSNSTSQILLCCATVCLLGLVWMTTQFHPAIPGFSSWEGQFGGDLYFTNTPDDVSTSRLSLFALWFGAVMVIYFCVTSTMGKLFRLFTPLKAYTLDISGSCLGIVAFMLMSWLQLPPFIWFLMLIPVYYLAQEGSSQLLKFGAIVALGGCSLLAYLQDQHLLSDPSFDGHLISRWSPYQKIELTQKHGRQILYANGIGHQELHQLGPLTSSFYTLPYVLRKQEPELKPYETALILGAGAGNDVAVALAQGVKEVTAVEIDPVIAEVGKRYHTAQPYLDARVTLVVGDGRTVLSQSKKTYDLIIFALTDSVIKASALSQIRLENFLFTQEAVQAAYDRLNEGGQIYFYNHFRTTWLRQKIEKLLYLATGKPPLIFQIANDFYVLTSGKIPMAGKSLPQSIQEPTDNWPFLYMKTPGLPIFYLLPMIGLSLLMSGFLVIKNHLDHKRGLLTGPLSMKLAFFFMGTAFLLLETKSIIQFSLLFGTTWLNNSLVFLGILSLVLLANWVAIFLSKNCLTALLALLILSCFMPYFLPLSWLAKITSPGLRFVAASLLTFTPIFLANLVFSLTFKDQGIPDQLFGWNLLGATIGGILEYTSLIWGYDALMIAVAFCYTLVGCFILVVVKKHQLSHPGAAAVP